MDFRRLWAEGKTYREISEALHIGARTLEKIRISLGLPKRNAGGFTRTVMAAKPMITTKCLCCHQEFYSIDKRINRVCAPCKETQMWSSG